MIQIEFEQKPTKKLAYKEKEAPVNVVKNSPAQVYLSI